MLPSLIERLLAILKNQWERVLNVFVDVLYYYRREWVEESGAWMQYVAKDPATRMDVISLQVSVRDGGMPESNDHTAPHHAWYNK